MNIANRTALFAATALSVNLVTPAFAQDAQEEADDAGSGNDIIVTAQRTEQKLQDVPISITVLSQETLANNNVTNPKDLVAYTPGLQVNSRYGSDNTTFTIRGFTQDQRTYATVGVFFNEVAAMRGSGATFGGDGAGPGQLFDLQNVQVLKGPQGTLFGRVVTGGAILLVPNKPKDRVEGYLEGGIGNYDMWRVQGVVNFPVSETFRMRVGFDHMDRKGYLKNIGRFGDGKFGNRGMGDVNYWAARASAVLDLEPDLENYTIFSYAHSQSNAVLPRIGQCNSAAVQFINANPADVIPLGQMACAQKAREDAVGFWAVSNHIPDHASINDQWQINNTLTWRASDSLTVKHIFSYGELKGRTNLDLFGNYFIRLGVTPGTEQLNQITGFAFTHGFGTDGKTNAQSTMINELQFQGTPGDGRFTWQAGLYLEVNNPLGFSGVQTATLTPCVDITVFNCVGTTPGLSVGTGAFSLTRNKFRDYAIYGQASYKLTESLTFTAGMRYTWDKVRSLLINETTNYNTLTVSCSNLTHPDFGKSFPLSTRFETCHQQLAKDTSAPTWMVGLDWKPIDEVLLYGKWSRGYRQGGLAFFGPDPLQPFNAEKVDTYEVGAKTNWRGSFPGFFNISGFYNDFRDQQLLIGISCDSTAPGFKGPCTGNAAIINAGKSRLWGFEIEAGVTAFDRLHINAAYGYLNTRITGSIPVTLPANGPWNAVANPKQNPAFCPLIEFCDVIPGTVPHKLTLSANLDLPIPESAGKLSIGGTMTYTSRYRVVQDTRPDQAIGRNAGVLPATTVLNLNATWSDVGGKPFDLGAFITNVTNEKVILQANDSMVARGFVSYLSGEPRMFGFRIRYKFGN